MNISGEIIIIEDDEEDRIFLAEIFEELGYPNKVVFFQDSTKVVEYLMGDVFPFMIISDINMPKLNGYQLRDIIFNDPRISDKCVPYIFFTTAQSNESVIQAYKMSVQGYFRKGNDFDQYKETIRKIVEYWKESVTPL